MDIFRRLRQEHARQRDLANRIMETAPGTERRRVLYRRLKAELDAVDSASGEWLRRFICLREDMEHHACEEEEFLFPAVRDCPQLATVSLMTHDYDAHKAGRPTSPAQAAPRAAGSGSAGVSLASH